MIGTAYTHEDDEKPENHKTATPMKSTDPSKQYGPILGYLFVNGLPYALHNKR